MACLVSSSFIVPFSSHAFFKEIDPRKSAWGGLSSQINCITDTKLSVTSSTNKRISSMNWSCWHLLSTNSRRFHGVVSSYALDFFKLIEVSNFADTKLSVSTSLNKRISSVNWRCWNLLSTNLRRHHEVVSCLLKLDSCTHSVIAGYWVGPDIDDGWGYIEAFVDSIT